VVSHRVSTVLVKAATQRQKLLESHEIRPESPKEKSALSNLTPDSHEIELALIYLDKSPAHLKPIVTTFLFSSTSNPSVYTFSTPTCPQHAKTVPVVDPNNPPLLQRKHSNVSVVKLDLSLLQWM